MEPDLPGSIVWLPIRGVQPLKGANGNARFPALRNASRTVLRDDGVTATDKAATSDHWRRTGVD